jgi:5-methylcytosine-specific restriction endonuclease McrA
MEFELEEYHRNIPDQVLIQDLLEVARSGKKDTVTMDEYGTKGKYHPTTLVRRFGSWPKALNRAGLKESRSKLNISDEELFENLKNLWIHLARQPRYKECKKPLSRYSARTYDNRFGSWRRALEALIEFIKEGPEEENGEDQRQQESKTAPQCAKPVTRRSKREISERQRFRILLRDGFRCLSCGRSPIQSPGIELHVDHIIPWSKGGETVDENLQTKCKECNLGKGNAFDQ